MRRKAVAALMLAAVSGCTTFQGGSDFGGGGAPWSRGNGPPTVPGLKGPHGESVAMMAPYDSAPPGSVYAARQMMNQSVPLSAVQMNGLGGMPGMPAMPPGGPNLAGPRGPMLTPPGVPLGPGMPAGPNMGAGPGMPPSPAARGFLPAGAMQPGTMPMGGGLINANIPPGAMPPGGFMPAHGHTQLAQAGPATGMRFHGQRTQVRFMRPSGMKVSWFAQGPDGQPTYSTTPVEAPGRYNFAQAAIYRLKLSNIEGRPGLEVYPTMEVVPSNPKTEAFLAHSAVPVEFTNEDFKQIAEGNYLVKVIYLPDPRFQDVAGTGTDEILSTRLEPGADPIQEALRRGSILVVIRMGNVDQEAPNTPALNAPGQHAGLPAGLPAPAMLAQPGAGPMPPIGPQAPPWAMKANMTQPNTTGPFAVPPALPGVPGPIPGGLEATTPQGTKIGTSSTSNFEDMPPPLLTAPALPRTSDSALPAPAESQTPAATPAAPPAPRLPEGPNLSGVPSLPTSHVPEMPPTIVPSADREKE